MAIRSTDRPISAPQPLEGEWPPQGRWTYADYRRLPDDGWRYEVIEGELLITPAPKTIHQRTSANLAFALAMHVRELGLGVVYYTPIDVILGEWEAPVQPDIVFIRSDRLHIVKEAYVEGPPDLMVEILSPSNWIADRRDKLRIYAVGGVHEYWIVDPEERAIEVFALKGSAYAQVAKSGPGGAVASQVLAGFSISVDEVCPE